MYEGKVIGVQLPQKMEFTVAETIDDAAAGNTATAVTKDATLETGSADPGAQLHQDR